MLRWKSWAALLLAWGWQLLPAAEAVLVPTPRASVMATTAASRPFLAAARAQQTVDLAARGYVESEHAVRGRHAGQLYTTRILVRRPLDARRFSGRVILEPFNASVLHESAPLWGFSWEHFLRRGDVWVGVTVSGSAVDALKRFNATRYAALTLGAAQAQGCAEDQPPSLQADVLAQTAALLRSSSKENPLLELNPQRVIAGGYAGAGNTVAAFAIRWHRQLRLGDAAPVFDGYLTAAEPAATVADACGPVASEGTATFLRDAAFVALAVAPAAGITINAEPTSDDAPGIRLYEVAGSAGARPSAAGMPAAADLAAAGIVTAAQSQCREPLMDRTLSYAMNAVWQQLEDWLLAGQPMARIPRLAAADGSMSGGWRLPDVDLPLTGSVPGQLAVGPAAARSPAACDAVWGSVPRLSSAMLKSRYGTRLEYLRRFNSALDQSVADRLLVKEDAAVLKATVTRTLPAF